MRMYSVVHFEMPSDDNKRVSDFYHTVFGWDMQQMGPDMGNYLLAMTTESDEKGPKKPGAINGGFYERSDNKPDQGTHFVIEVDDIKEHVKRVTEGGGVVQGDVMDIPGVGKYVSFKDTEGNSVGMLQPVKM